MNKYFSKALFYDERKNYSANIALVSMILIMGLVRFFINLYIKNTNDLEVSKEIFRSNLLDTIYVVIFFMIAGILATLYESYNLKEVKYNFMLTQPYNRDAIVVTKFIATVGSAIIPLVIYGAIISVIFINDTTMIVEAWKRLLLASAVAIFTTAIGQFFNNIIGKTIIAIFMPIIILPIILIIMVFARIMIPLPIFFETIMNFFETAVNYFFGNLAVSQIILSMVLVIMSIVLTMISIFINRKITFEKTSDIFLFKWVEVISVTIFSFIISAVVVLGILILIDKFIFKIKLTNSITVIILDVIIIVCTIVVYKTINYIKGRVS